MRRILGVAGICLLCGGVSGLIAAEISEAPQEFSVAEDATSGMTIGRVSAGDQAAGASVTYQIVHDGGATPARIDPITGELAVGVAHLDFEAQPRYVFTVKIRSARALDPARRAYVADLVASGVDPSTLDDLLFQVAERVVAINVTDAPEPPVLSTTPVTLVVRNDDAPATAQIVVNDPDAGETHTFELLDAAADQFVIDPHTGVLTRLSGAAVHGGTIPVTVRVTDSAGLSDAATYNVEVVVPATPVVAATTPGESALPSAGTLPVVTPLAPVNNDVPPDMDEERPQAVAVAPAPPVELPEPVSLPATTTHVEAEMNPESAAAAAVVLTPDQAGDVAPATASQGGLAIWLPIVVLGVGLAGLSVFWLRRRRELPAVEAQMPKFRVVREARTSSPAAAEGLRAPEATDELSADAPASKFNMVADEKAAVHELLASAFQKSVGAPAPAAPETAVAERQASAPPAVEIESIVDVEPAVAVETSAEVEPPAPIETRLQDVPPAWPVEARFEAVAPVSSSVNMIPGVLPEPVAELRESGEAPAMLPGRMVAEEELEPFPDTEPLSPTCAMGDMSALHDDIPSGRLLGTDEHSSSVEADSGGYHAIDEDEHISAYGLRLSQSVAPSTREELAASMREPEPSESPRSRECSPTGGDSRAEAGDDSKLQDLRRQLSDLFGVPADRPRPIPSGVVEDEEPAPVEEATAPSLEEVSQRAAQPEQVVDAAPAAAATAEESTADPTDPVSSWLAYVKQRALEQPGTTAKPAVAVPPPPPPVAAPPVAREIPAIPMPPAPRSRTETPPASVARVNKTAVREEISMLRDVANQYSRQILERRAMHQRARFNWVIWGTLMVVLSFGGLATLKQSSGLVRMIGWGLLGGAAIALAGCIQGFRNLSGRSEGSSVESHVDSASSTAEFEEALAPELMTPEMEAKLRSVLEESRSSVAVGAGDARK